MFIRYRRCSWRITPEQLRVVENMYWYDSISYNRVRPETVKFLREHLRDAPPETQVIALGQHNARGRLWGILVVQRPSEEDWTIIGHFGVPFKTFTFTPALEYYALTWFGHVPQSYPRPDCMPRDNALSLERFYRQAVWYDRVNKMDPFDLFFYGAPAL